MLINKFVCKPVCSGSKTKKIGHLDVDHIVWDSEQEIQPIIQSYAEACKIENIIARMTLGDSSVLSSRGEGVYLSKEQAESLNKDSVQINKELSEIYLNQYNSFKGKDYISYNEFVNLLRAGDFNKLSSYIKEEVKNNE